MSAVTIRKLQTADTSFGDRGRTISGSAVYGVYQGDTLVAKIRNDSRGGYRDVASWRVMEPDDLRERTICPTTFRTLALAKAYVLSPAFVEDLQRAP